MLLGLLMHLVLFARAAELFQFKAILENLFVLGRAVVERLALSTLEFDESFLGHKANSKSREV